MVGLLLRRTGKRARSQRIQRGGCCAYTCMTITRTLTTLAATAALAFGAAACGDDSDDSGSTKQSTPEPVAQIDTLTGEVTAVKLDAGFVEALGALKIGRAHV